MASELTGPEATKQGTVAVNSAGLIVAASLGGIYLLWALFVVSGFAQPLINFISGLHVIGPLYVIEEVDPLRAAGLVVLAGAIGYGIGGALAVLWNRAHDSAGRGVHHTAPHR